MKYYIFNKGDYSPTYYFTVSDSGFVDVVSSFCLPPGYGRSERGDYFAPNIPEHCIKYMGGEFKSADKTKWWGGYEMSKNDFEVMSKRNERKRWVK